MIDLHTHIGNFNNGVYYNYKSVFKSLLNCRVSGCWCAYLTPRNDTYESAKQFADYMLNEIKNAKKNAEEIGLKVHWLYWIDPILIDSIFDRFSEFCYEGIAIHPFHAWTEESYRKAFLFASQMGKPIFLHTGCSENDNPLLFEKYIKKFPNVEVHLAHCKDPEPIIELFSKYPNLLGDVAFCPQDSYEAICKAGFKDRMLFGTDFPITHWYHHYGEEKIDTTVESLTESYKKTLNEMSWFGGEK